MRIGRRPPPAALVQATPLYRRLLIQLTGIDEGTIETFKLKAGDQEYYSPALIADFRGQRPSDINVTIANSAIRTDEVALLPHTDCEAAVESEQIQSIAGVVREETNTSLTVEFADDIRNDVAIAERAIGDFARILINLHRAVQDQWPCSAILAHEAAHLLVLHYGYQRTITGVHIKRPRLLEERGPEIKILAERQLGLLFNFLNDLATHFVINHLLIARFNGRNLVDEQMRPQHLKNVKDLTHMGYDGFNGLIAPLTDETLPPLIRTALSAVHLLKQVEILLFAPESMRDDIIAFQGAAKEKLIDPIIERIGEYVPLDQIGSPDFLDAFTPAMFQALYDGLTSYFRLAEFFDIAYAEPTQATSDKSSAPIQEARRLVEEKNHWAALSILARVLEQDATHNDAQNLREEIRNGLLAAMLRSTGSEQAACRRLARLAEHRAPTEAEYWSAQTVRS
ncbi:hypothetical protein ACFL5U_03270 [Candidatus Margulisiibacteriota bacterium]